MSDYINSLSEDELIDLSRLQREAWGKLAPRIIKRDRRHVLEHYASVPVDDYQ